MKNNAYKQWLADLKARIRSVQIRAAVAVNRELVRFYWELGGMITARQTAWGSGFVDQLSKDLRAEFPDMAGFSPTSLKYCRLVYRYFTIGQQPADQLSSVIGQQPADQLSSIIGQQPADQLSVDELKLFPCPEILLQLPWGHITLIIGRIKDIEEAWYYIKQTIAHYWSRDVLALQIKSGLYRRQGKAITNFAQTLPAPFSDLANQTLKDPYVFDFMTMAIPFREKDIEDQLVNHISKFLLELGRGFAFVGRQYLLAIHDNDYYLDLLFYHTRLKCYIVIELKNTAFMPEYTGKLNFYLSAVDSLLKQEDDKPTIGILLCRDKNNINVEFALRGMNKPIGVSEFNITGILPDDLKSSLPTIEELENELIANQPNND